MLCMQRIHCIHCFSEYTVRNVSGAHMVCIVCIEWLYTVYTFLYVAYIVYIVFNVYISYIADIASFTKQVQNRVHAMKYRMADSNLRSAFSPKQKSWESIQHSYIVQLHRCCTNIQNCLNIISKWELGKLNEGQWPPKWLQNRFKMRGGEVKWRTVTAKEARELPKRQTNRFWGVKSFSSCSGTQYSKEWVGEGRRHVGARGRGF